LIQRPLAFVKSRADRDELLLAIQKDGNDVGIEVCARFPDDDFPRRVVKERFFVDPL
jgi:hypothetical protein